MRRILALLLAMLASGPSAADMYQDGSNAKLPEARANLHTAPAIDVRDYGAKCDGTTDDLPAFQAADAALAANSGGMIGVPGYPRICRLASGYEASLGVGLVGLEPILVSHDPARQIGPRIQCATLNAPCVTVGQPANSTGGLIKNLIVGYNGTPTAGAKAVVIRGYNSICDNVAVYNAYDAFTFTGGISSRCNNLFTSSIVHDHVTQDGSPELYINGARFNGPVASNAFVVFTGQDPNGFMCNQCQFNLASISPSYLFQFRNITSQTNGIYQLVNSVVDMSLGTCQALIKTDATAFVNRMQISNSFINAPVCNFIDQSTQLQAPHALQVTNNPFVAVSGINISAGTTTAAPVFDFRGNVIFNNVTLGTGAASWTGIFSDNKVSGSLTVTSAGGPWLDLALNNNRVSGTITDTAATGKIYYSGVGQSWVPVPKLGATTVSVTGTAGTATRQSDGSIKYHLAFTVSNKNGGTGALTVTGAPYTCADNARAILGGTGYLGLTGAPQIGALGGGGFALNQYTATGTTALLDTNVQVGTVVTADVVCPAT